MREPDFMPAWYPLLLRRRRVVAIQAWILGLIAAGLTAWGFLGQHQIRASSARLGVVQQQLAQTGVDLQRLNDIEVVKRELEHQDQIVRALGVHIPASRMVQAIDELMPPSIALQDLEINTVDVPETLTDSQRAGGVKPRIFRNLQVQVDGLAPSGVELGTFMSRLDAVPYVSQVALVRAADAVQSGRQMRTFELNFVINLDTEEDRGEVATVSGN